MYEIIYYCQLGPGSPSPPPPRGERSPEQVPVTGGEPLPPQLPPLVAQQRILQSQREQSKKKRLSLFWYCSTLPLSGCFIVFGYVSMSSIFRYCGGDGKGGRNRPTNRICCLVNGETLSVQKRKRQDMRGKIALHPELYDNDNSDNLS